MVADSIVLTFLTFNIWGLPSWITKNKEERVKAIGPILSSLDVDVICLQEVWIESDYQQIKSALQSTLPYSHYFYSGVTGSGTCIFSKYPIVEILFHQWPLNGYIHMVHHGDWFGGKGVGLAVLDVHGYKVNVYTTHLHAQYHEDDHYLVHRIEQAFDTAMFVRLTSGDAHFSVIGGDFNAIPGSVCEQLLLHVANLKDSYVGHDKESAGGTNDCSRNSYSNPELVSMNPDGLRIDYLLFKSSQNVSSKVLKYTFPLERRIPGRDFSYSDHEAVLATFEINSGTPNTHVGSDQQALEKSLAQSISLCTEALEDTNSKSTFYWAVSATLFCVLFLSPLVFDVTVLHSPVYLTLLACAICSLVFFILMATIWCKMEFHGILGARDRMVVLFESLKKNN